MESILWKLGYFVNYFGITYMLDVSEKHKHVA